MSYKTSQMLHLKGNNDAIWKYVWIVPSQLPRYADADLNPKQKMDFIEYIHLCNACLLDD